MRNGIFLSAFGLVVSLTVLAALIFGFDIDTPKSSRRALSRILENGKTTTRFYKIDEHFAFGVFLDREPGEMDVIISTYERNVVPFCFFCGWYTGNSDERRSLIQPYLANGYAYSKEIQDEDWGGVPAGEYPVLNLETAEFSHVNDLHKLPQFPADSGHIITREYVSENYDEISYFGHDDEDCLLVFAALLLCYIILAIWGLGLWLRGRWRRVE